MLRLLVKVFTFYESQAHAFGIVGEDLVTRLNFPISFFVLTVKTYP